MNAASKPAYRRIRNGWGLVLGVTWIAWRWSVLRAQHAAAIVGLDHCTGILNGIGCSMRHSAADGNYGGGVFLAILSAPLALILTHYFARWRVERDEQTVADAERQQDAARQEAQRQEREARMALVERDAQRAHQTVERSDFIHKIGAVSDFLDLLASERDPSRIANIRLGATGALRDLIAKHTVSQLTAVIRSDDAVQLSLTTILRRLSADGFDHAAEVQLLRNALQESTMNADLLAR